MSCNFEDRYNELHAAVEPMVETFSNCLDLLEVDIECLYKENAWLKEQLAHAEQQRIILRQILKKCDTE